MSDGGTAEARRSERLRERAREVQTHAVDLNEATRGALEELGGVAREQLRSRPYTALGVCAAAGFVLGGGLSVQFLRALGGLGTRIALSAAAREFVNGLETSE